MNTVNPFNDPEFKNQILQKEGRSYGDPEIVEYEVFQETDEVLDGIISSAPKIPGQVKNVILDASAIAKNSNDAKASEMNIALNEVFTSYNKEYGTDLQIDFSSLSRTLVNVSDPESRRTLELYVSEVFQSIRPVLLLHMMNKLALALDYILDPQRMLGGEMTIQDTFIAAEKILQFIQQLEDMKRDIIIRGSDLELKKMADENNIIGEDSRSKQVIQDFMDCFKRDSGLPE